MADISTELAAILAAVYGEEVRGSIHDAIAKINEVSMVVISAGTAVSSETSSSTGFFEDSLYINTATCDLWKCVGTDAWDNIGNLKGIGIVNITKTGTSGLVDTYTVTLTDGNTYTFNVTNGNGIASITGPVTVGLVDTYTINYTDGTTRTFNVTNGKDGVTWYKGTGISGKHANPTVYAGSGITDAHSDDFFLNTEEQAVYHCVTGGGPTVATWVYDFTMSGSGASYGAGTGIDITNDVISLDASIGDLNDVTITGNVSDGQLLTYDGVNHVFKNKNMDRSVVRYGGQKYFSKLTAELLDMENMDKFYTIIDGGTLDENNVVNWSSMFSIGDVIPADAHIAVILEGEALKFDDFGGYVDISGKADKSELPIKIIRTGVTVSAGAQVRVPSSGTNPNITSDRLIIPIGDNNTDRPIKCTSVVQSLGYVTITVAEALSNAEVGVLVY